MQEFYVKFGKELKISPKISVIVIKQSQWGVQIGTIAPKNVSIWREEIYKKIKKEK